MAESGKRIALLALFLGGLALIALTFLSGPTRFGGFGGMMGGYDCMVGGYGGTSGFGTAGTIVRLLGQLGFLLLLLGGGYLLYQALVNDAETSNFGASDSAVAELRGAYARGEVSDEEFETRRKRLQQSEGR